LSAFQFLLSGLDTVECAYSLAARSSCLLDFRALGVQKESLRQSKSREPARVTLGDWDFLFHPHGSVNGGEKARIDGDERSRSPIRS
jgi:hypothetical protein